MKKQKYCDPLKNQFRQHLLDHIEGLEKTIRGVLNKSKVEVAAVKGICIDTTGSSPVPVTKKGIPLAFIDGFQENPNAMMVLWKCKLPLKVNCLKA